MFKIGQYRDDAGDDDGEEINRDKGSKFQYKFLLLEMQGSFIPNDEHNLMISQFSCHL